ncbi:NAD(+) diphosphatase [Oceanobacter mangrovi]|uniref:NAD(+) diphosphatase n=1 Tax=Oceanobacter mangrovi TaxID=2862510 RepID=UPI001C8F070E|nr:NAD(+) diphosphatase [Oceanobacter mangrovi]
MGRIEHFELCEYQAEQHIEPDCYLLVAGGELLSLSSGELALLTRDEFEVVQDRLQIRHGPAYVGIANQRHPCQLVVLEQPVELANTLWQPPRAVLPHLTAAEYTLVSRGLQLGVWARDHAYCGSCGAKTVLHGKERAMHCEACNKFYFPRINPCVITIVTKGEYCLLAHHTRYATDFYSTLAGFIEAGETIEDAVHREIFEEVGIRVTNLHYFGSQSWPFPGQLMVGFMAEHAEGDICIDGDEIDDARWFHYSELPQVPGTVSISGQLIQHFVDRCQQS